MIRKMIMVLSLMLFIMGIVYGGVIGVDLCCFSIILFILSSSIIEKIQDKIKIYLNKQSYIFMYVFLVVVFLSLFEIDASMYNVIMSILCTLIFFLIIFYFNIVEKVSLEKFIKEKLEKDDVKKRKIKIKKEKCKGRLISNHESINKFFKENNYDFKYVRTFYNSYSVNYVFKVSSSIKVEEVEKINKDLEVYLGRDRVKIDFNNEEVDEFVVRVYNNNIFKFNKIMDEEEFVIGEEENGKIYKEEISENYLLLGNVGCGKSNLINTLLCNIIYNMSEKDIDLILIDNEETGLDIYNNIPHLVLPISNNKDRSLKYIKLVNDELERRKNVEEDYRKLVVIIDEVFNLGDVEYINIFENLISYGPKYNIYLIISTSNVENKFIEYLTINIKNIIYFYQREESEYNKFINKNNVKGLINYKGKVIRSAYISDDEIREIVGEE